MSDAFLSHIRMALDEIEAAGLLKRERLLAGPQGGHIRVAAAPAARARCSTSAPTTISASPTIRT